MLKHSKNQLKNQFHLCFHIRDWNDETFRRIFQLLVLVCFSLFALFTFLANNKTSMAAIPKVTQDDSNPAMNNPDLFAWSLFVQLNHPADERAGRGIPDKTKQIGDASICRYPNGTHGSCRVVWETWKNARNEIFLPNGADPGAWDAPETSKLVKRMSDRFDMPKAKVIKILDSGGDLDRITAAFDPGFIGGNETRLNKAAFDFIVANNLFYVEGQECFHEKGRKVDFPRDAMEIKAQWRELGDEGSVGSDTLRKYHFAIFNKKVYGLSGLHITTKDIPNWFWATFEHVDNPPPELPDVDRSGRPTILKGTKWENYRLRGSMTNFVDSRGQNTILANTQIEQSFQMTSSCISCHANATIGDRVNLPPGTFVPPAGVIGGSGASRLTIFTTRIANPLNPLNPTDSDPDMIYGPVGIPDPALFLKGARFLNNNVPITFAPRYTQLDFVYALYRARRRPSPRPCQ